MFYTYFIFTGVETEISGTWTKQKYLHGERQEEGRGEIILSLKSLLFIFLILVLEEGRGGGFSVGLEGEKAFPLFHM